MQWIYLVGAILSEVSATVALKASDGFSKVVPSIIVAVGYLLAFLLLSQVLKLGMNLGVAYGIWAATGVALVAVAGVVLFGDNLTWVQAGGLALIAGGVLALELGAAH